MEDNQIISLYFQRSEQAIKETDRKYGKFCFKIAYNILSNREDSEESVNDTYLRAWNAIPPKKPSPFAAFLGRITRSISIDRWRRKNADMRGCGEFPLCLDELDSCVSGKASVENQAMMKEAVVHLNQFLSTLPDTERKVFLRRYWYMESTQAIADSFGFTQTKVTTMLSRTRKKLRSQLEKEGLL